LDLLPMVIPFARASDPAAVRALRGPVGPAFALSGGVPVDRVTVVVGLSSVLNALFGGHPAITSRSGIPIGASPDAGPKAGRYWTRLIAGALSLLIALAARPLAMLLSIRDSRPCPAAQAGKRNARDRRRDHQTHPAEAGTDSTPKERKGVQ
jgi:hypothetical protein